MHRLRSGRPSVTLIRETRKPAAGVAPGTRSLLWRQMRQHRWHYAFLAPMAVLLVMFTIWPIVASWGISFYDWDGFEPLDRFIGFDNFTEAVESPLFWQAFRQTFVFTAVAIFVQMPLALGFAILLNNLWLTGRNIYRMLIFIPVITTTAVVGVAFTVLLNPRDGPINAWLQDIGLVDSPINFLGSESLALPTVLAVDLWKGVGITMIYFLAALQTIPKELYDAAKIDCASAWQRFRYVTVPLLIPIGTIILLLTTITSFNAFDLVQTMTAGGPNFSTDIIPTYIFRTAFDPGSAAPRYGFASAAALFFGVAVLILTIVLVIPARKARLERQAGRG